MNSISHNKRYLPHDVNTKFHAVITFRNGNDIDFVCRKYHCSRSSLWRWNKKYDDHKESLIDKSHRILSKHPHSHTDEGIKWQVDVKYVPKECKAITLPNDKHFYQYTCIDEASRERFIFHCKEHTPLNTIDFIKKCFIYYDINLKSFKRITV